MTEQDQVLRIEREQDLITIGAMIDFGGGFVEALGRAARKADLENLKRIKVAFPKIWTQYNEVGNERRRAHDEVHNVERSQP